MTWWADAGARARGLTGHLLDAPDWRRLHEAPDLPSLCQELKRLGYPLEPGADARVAERAVERMRRQRQALLARWLGSRTRHLRIVLEVDDRRAIRALLRGAATDLPPAERLAVVPPSCGLSRSMTEKAATASTPEECLAILAELGQPLADRAEEECRVLEESWPDLPRLLALETALVRAWAIRAVEGARRGGSRVRERVARTLDLENAWSVLVLVPGDSPPPEATFLDGGESLSLDLFKQALDTGDREAARAILGRGLPDAVGEMFADSALPPMRLQRAVLQLAVRHEERALRREPLGPASLFAFLLRIRLESHDLRGLLWGRALGAPPDVMEIA
ncbi:MAG: V-type ATPase subunit [Gemmatimonadota bacterium]